MRWGRSSDSDDKPGVDWEAKKAKAGKNARDSRTEHDKRAPLTDEQVLDMLEKPQS